MVDRMMELTALETRRVLDTVQPVALLPLLEELAHASHGVATQRGCRINVAASEDMTVEADPFCCAVRSSNLLDNALDFLPEGGHVELGLQVQGRWAQITVRDQGPGIPGYAQDKVFEKFYSLARPHYQEEEHGVGAELCERDCFVAPGEGGVGQYTRGGGPVHAVRPLVAAKSGTGLQRGSTLE